LWNREHVYPKSLATPSLSTGDPSAGTDAHSLRASDSEMNFSRCSRRFEDGTGDAKITATTGNWYPGDEWKGDVARMIMYMYLRYPTQCEATAVGVGSNSYSPFGDMPDVFLEWNAEVSMISIASLSGFEFYCWKGLVFGIFALSLNKVKMLF